MILVILIMIAASFLVNVILLDTQNLARNEKERQQYIRWACYSSVVTYALFFLLGLWLR